MVLLVLDHPHEGAYINLTSPQIGDLFILVVENLHGFQFARGCVAIFCKALLCQQTIQVPLCFAILVVQQLHDLLFFWGELQFISLHFFFITLPFHLNTLSIECFYTFCKMFFIVSFGDLIELLHFTMFFTEFLFLHYMFFSFETVYNCLGLMLYFRKFSEILPYEVLLSYFILINSCRPLLNRFRKNRRTLVMDTFFVALILLLFTHLLLIFLSVGYEVLQPFVFDISYLNKV